ncbi:MAG TPA: protein kinase [Thermoanaerobaculia bacterium]|nr:protein kinase [Thermoanaerobaculia bacterium]
MPGLRRRRGRRALLPGDGVRRRRGPRLPVAADRPAAEDKALDVSRQLCAGLAAVHDPGVLHRDLKPANVMLDGDGRVRLTDFGLAAAAADAAGGELAGTPQYMAPEQFAGRDLSPRSDVYALGLVLYELFTGKPAVAGATFEELRRRHPGAADAALARAPGPQCGRRAGDPALPREGAAGPPHFGDRGRGGPAGGRPARGGLAAGETPSPEMVAAAGAEGALRPAAALACLAGVGVGLLCLVLLGSRYSLGGRVGAEIKPPEVLAERARGIVELLGYPGRPGSSSSCSSPMTRCRATRRSSAAPSRSSLTPPSSPWRAVWAFWRSSPLRSPFLW